LKSTAAVINMCANFRPARSLARLKLGSDRPIERSVRGRFGLAVRGLRPAPCQMHRMLLLLLVRRLLTLPPLYSERGLCNGRVSVRLSRRSWHAAGLLLKARHAGARYQLSVDIYRRRQSSAAGSVMCCDPRRMIDADLLCSAVRSVRLSVCPTVSVPCLSSNTVYFTIEH